MILVTGATGMFGSRITTQLLARRAPVRAMAHSDASAASLTQPGLEVAVGDMDDPPTLAEPMRGVDTVFLVSPMDDRIQAREIAVVDAAKAAGARRIVKLHGAVEHRGDPLAQLHDAAIQAVKDSGLRWALLSPNSVMETSFLSQAAAIQWMNATYGCCGDGRVGHVAAEDVARAGAVVLADRDENGAEYKITGPEALSMAQVCAIMSEVLGRTITYNDMPEDQFRDMLVQHTGRSAEEVELGVLVHFRAWKRGDAEIVTDTYRDLTGLPPTTVAQWVAAHREAFEKPAAPPQPPAG
jgi:uncharacterized protein YbjT (DUF2867 family)